MPEVKTHAGFVAIIGLPNAGKSTFLNGVLGHKVSIVTPKAQTTRMPVRGILTENDTQIIFVDTPGLHVGNRMLEEQMFTLANQAWRDADAVLHVIDATKGFREEDEKLAQELKTANKPLFIAVNKVDLIKEKEQLLPLLQTINDLKMYDEVFPISALKGVAVERLVASLASAMPESPFLYDPKALTDMPQSLHLAEITREKAFLFLQQELPYGMAVENVQMEEMEDGSIRIDQNIIIEREAHKRMVIGHKGAMLKRIGTAARKDMTRDLGRKVHLFLKVKVKKGWAENHRQLQELGFSF